MRFEEPHGYAAAGFVSKRCVSILKFSPILCLLQVKDPGIVPLGIGWTITWSFLLSWVLIIILVVVDETSRRKTVSGQQCYKWFGECDRHVCVKLNATGPPDLHDLNDWEEGCDDVESVDKVGSFPIFVVRISARCLVCSHVTL